MKKLLTTLLLAAALTACAGNAAQPTLTDYSLPAEVEIIFNVLVPANTPAGESVSLNLVDELTGLSFNTHQYAMQASGQNSYSVAISVPQGTLLNYRYSRQGAAGPVTEASALGEPIAYRAFLVDGPGHVAHDLVPAWADLPVETPTGQVNGVVTAAGSGEPLANLRVNASGIRAITDEAGSFRIAGLPQGLHNMVISAPDGSYLSFQQGALVAAGAETPAAIQLTATGFATVTFTLSTAENSPSAVPVYLLGSLSETAAKPQLAANADGTYSLSVQLPTGVDLRYKYTLGDGFWNAEHASDGGFVVRQLIIPAGTPALTINDSIAAWTAGSSAPIWFDLTAPDGEPAYLQFNLQDWMPALPMWNLGGGHFAYVLYSPTNFSDPLEYRYCGDVSCTRLEAGAPVRTISGNQESIQQIQDSVAAWQ